ncbi:MAG: DUF1259 domain-containing protein, partial [Planctomycetota bacterium]|nr:DUF1259 domain-containing protein [Planctomycetota bacterium]
VRSGLDKIAELRKAKGLEAAEDPRAVESSLVTSDLDRILGKDGKTIRGVHKYVFGRPKVKLKDHGIAVTTFSGFNTWMAFQGTMEKAAVAGDFTMLAREVTPVIKALVSQGIEVTAVHNHMVHEEPRVFFLHYWGVGPAEDLARGLRKALDTQE